MAVKDLIPIKYWIPKLEFTVRLGTSQYFKIMYKLYTDDWNNDNDWTVARDQYLIQPDGTTSESDKLILSNLVENREYVIRIVDTRNKNFNFRFKTGSNIALADSPYYNKVLMPGQIFDWFINNIDKLGIPTKSECDFYYALSGKKAVTIDTDNWGSILTYTVDPDGFYKPTPIDGKWDKTEDSNGIAEMGSYINNLEGQPVQMIAPPNLKYNGTEYISWGAYWANDGGGGICADDIIRSGYNIGFSFLIKSLDNDDGADRILCTIDASKVKDLNAAYNYKWSLGFSVNGNLVSEYTDASGTVQKYTDTNVFQKNKWYYIKLSASSAKVYNLADKVAGTINTTECIIKTPENSLPADKKEINVVTPLIFGSPTTKGVIIGKFAGGIKTAEVNQFINKVVNPEKFFPHIKLIITYSDNTTETVDSSSKFTSVVTPIKVSFLIDPDIFNTINIPAGATISKVEAKLMIGTDPRDTKVFNGFVYKDASTNSNIVIPPLKDPKNYIQESFELIFANKENPIESLAQYFFTKHGTWGGYNGGVNGHNLYFNGEGNLILENHGDKYTGSMKGVGKENDVSPYTGYGSDVPYSNYAFDNRTNKSCLRTGTALVSNKYFTYGRCDVVLKMPIGCWGICPAIWLFHYIEISESDYRYNQAPYNERNVQGSSEDGYHRVVNNEIDIELPSHLTNGVLNNWSVLPYCYFDMDVITTDLIIGVKNGSSSEIGQFRLTDIANPKQRSSWVKVGQTVVPRYEPSFQNCKFNNWIGEREGGSGWAAPIYDEYGIIKYSGEQVYKGIPNNNDIAKEEYHSQLLHLANNLNGYADGQFHKWSIVWLPDRTILLVDDNVISENRGFVPFNQMKLTIAGWFPTMPAVYKVSTDPEGNVTKTAIGVSDRDGIHGAPGSVIKNLDDTAQKSIGTWAGTRAMWDILHMELKAVKWEKYNVGDEINFNDKITRIDKEPDYLGESFPESGLRSLVVP